MREKSAVSESTRALQHVGVVACSLPGASPCIRAICEQCEQNWGAHVNPEISLNMQNFAEHVACVEGKRWDALASMLEASASALGAAGADFLICPDNTAHRAYPLLADRLALPWVHIAEPVARRAVSLGYRRLGLLGTRVTCEGGIYEDVCEAHDLTLVTPPWESVEALHELIFAELSREIVSEAGRRLLHDTCEALAREGCDAVILGCTELPLLCAEVEPPLPTLDSTRLLALEAAARAAGVRAEDC